MSTRVFAAPVSLDVRMMSFSRLGGGGGGRPRIVPSPICLSRVKRCLFGLPTSPQEAIQQAAVELQRQTEADSQRWNFDFAREQPLNGPFDWQSAGDEPLCDRVEKDADPVSPSAPLRQSQITGKYFSFDYYYQYHFSTSRSVGNIDTRSLDFLF